MAKISAVVLTYNKAHVLERFVKSLLNQERKPDEVFVVDDCSTDGTKKLLWPLCSRWNLILLRQNSGQSNARNVGFEKVTGQYVIFLDGDLGMRPDMISKMEAALDRDPGASVAYCHYDRIGSRMDNVRSEPWNPNALRHRNYVSMISMVRCKDLPRPPFDATLRRYEDWDLWIRMMKAGKRGVLIDEALFTAFYHPGDLSGTGESIDWQKVVSKKHGFS